MTELLSIAAVATTLTSVVSAQAQNYPSRPITIVVPFAAGGPTDIIARVMGERMRASLGQTVIIENVTGAAGSIASRPGRAGRSGWLHDHHRTLGHHVVNGVTYTLQYDLLKDLAPIAMIATTPSLIVSKRAVPAKDLKELIAWLKANPGKAAQGSGGAGSAAHIHGVFFQQRTGTQFQHVPYRGAAPAMQDLIGGQIDLMIDQVSNSLQHARTGKIRAYAVTAKARLEFGAGHSDRGRSRIGGFPHIGLACALGSAATPGNVIATLNAAVVDALADPKVRQRLMVDLGQDIPPRAEQTPQALGVLHKAEIEKWWPVIRGGEHQGQLTT